ncbi:TIGR03936 family radical SAM-associated protein [Oscillibacter sp. MSJ-2]|uniref:TIGR03936 family radical SAM-associated protein n=1 Tax=Dysosmobacter acutus TaxID=2841504 RepID=A0ABS6F9R8_9FIRM|nr:TIGR03936 family radical SAM-associated protein [Dysosmobacter acutus]MBU5627038.1 TIGR03936 family radical SAM-associated protein [Dysosmobacter acutus]
MSKLRLLFVKEAQASYISHLDLMRTFQRVFPRTGLEISHSQGFHPHPILSIVLPLPVGQSSQCELLDFTVEQETDGAGVPELLNPGFPKGLRVLECYPAVRPVKELASIRAKVEFLYDNGVPPDTVEQLGGLFSRESIVIQKKTKRRALADVDIRPMIRELTFTEREQAVKALAVVQAQNPGLNPALLGEAIRRELPECAPDFVRVRRLELIDQEGAIFR